MATVVRNLFVSGVLAFDTPVVAIEAKLVLPGLEGYGNQITAVQLFPPSSDLDIVFLGAVGVQDLTFAGTDGEIAGGDFIDGAVLSAGSGFVWTPSSACLFVSDASLYLNVLGFPGDVGYRVFYNTVSVTNTQRLELLTSSR